MRQEEFKPVRQSPGKSERQMPVPNIPRVICYRAPLRTEECSDCYAKSRKEVQEE